MFAYKIVKKLKKNVAYHYLKSLLFKFNKTTALILGEKKEIIFTADTHFICNKPEFLKYIERWQK